MTPLARLTLRSRVFGACAALLVGSSIVAAPGAGAITGSACNQPIVVARLAFGPGTVTAGQQSTARLSGRNCTRHPKTVRITWSGQYAGGGVKNCPTAVDPIVQTVDIPAASALTAHEKYLVPKKCTAKLFTVTARVTDAAGKLIKTKSAGLRITHPHG